MDVSNYEWSNVLRKMALKSAQKINLLLKIIFDILCKIGNDFKKYGYFFVIFCFEKAKIIYRESTLIILIIIQAFRLYIEKEKKLYNKTKSIIFS
jgi:hypothetical protein